MYIYMQINVVLLVLSLNSLLKSKKKRYSTITLPWQSKLLPKILQLVIVIYSHKLYIANVYVEYIQ